MKSKSAYPRKCGLKNKTEYVLYQAALIQTLILNHCCHTIGSRETKLCVYFGA